MSRKFKVGDIVIPKFTPNAGQMSIHENLGKMFGGTEENPMYNCKYFDKNSNSYITERFLESDLKLA